ncbi:MAG: peptide ABC transporter substrate-binding protein, partial [Actinomyces sp.]
MAVSAPALAGCVRFTPVDPDATRPTASGSAAAGSATVSFTDSTGREVELPREITRVAPASPLADIMLFPIAAEQMVGWSSTPGSAAVGVFGSSYRDLPELGKIDAAPADFAREAVLASAPQVIVDVGAWDEEYRAGLDSLQEDLGIPVILIDGALDVSGDAFRLLGQALGKTDLGEQLGAYADGVISDVRARTASIARGQRLRVYYGEG